MDSQLINIGSKALAALTLLFGTFYTGMRIIYKILPSKNGRNNAKNPGPKAGEAQLCRDHQEAILLLNAEVPRIGRAVSALYKDRFGVDPL